MKHQTPKLKTAKILKGKMHRELPSNTENHLSDHFYTPGFLTAIMTKQYFSTCENSNDLS